MTIEVRIDRRDGAEVTVDDCVAASRALEAILDGGSLVPENYELQVSSPGERELRTPAEWRRFVGRWASVSVEGSERFEARITGVEGEDQDLVVVLEQPGIKGRKATVKRVPLAAMQEARLAFHL